MKSNILSDTWTIELQSVLNFILWQGQCRNSSKSNAPRGENYSQKSYGSIDIICTLIFIDSLNLCVSLWASKIIMSERILMKQNARILWLLIVRIFFFFIFALLGFDYRTSISEIYEFEYLSLPEWKKIGS